MRPIFIVGCQRSGSTMLGALLGAAQRSIAIPEAQFVAELAPADATWRGALAPVIDRIAQHYRFRIWNFDLQGARPEGEGSYADAIRWLVRRYADFMGVPELESWIDHQPGHVREMAVLRSHFPELQCVHVVRDGRAVAASIMKLNWGPNTVQPAANYWVQRVAMGAALRDYLGEAKWIGTRYEDLVREPEPQLRRLCAFLGLDYVPQMASGGDFKVPAFTQGQHSLVGKAPDLSRLDGWRTSLSAREIEIFEALVGPLLIYHGYGLDHDGKARLPGFMEKGCMTLKDQWRARHNAKDFAAQVRKFGG